MQNNKNKLRRHLLLTTALVVPGLIGYGGRKAYGACVNTGGTTYLCSGNETTSQSVYGFGGAQVAMDAGATIDTSATGGDAITITGDGDLSFTNTAGGAISGAETGLVINNYIFAPGSVTVTTDQAITGGYHGVKADNSGYGALTINVNNVAGTAYASEGIYARNEGTDLSITATGTVLGGRTGIDARNDGSGTLGVIANNVTGTSRYGIDARNSGGGDLSITTTGTVYGGGAGIRASNYISSGALIINANDVSGRFTGIHARNVGTGALTINANDAIGSSRNGIYARNVYGTDLSINITGTVNGGRYSGLHALNSGSGALVINVNNVTGTSHDGINARNFNGSNLSITTTGDVTGRNRGIYARNRGAGALIINANNVLGTTQHGVEANNYGAGTDLSISMSGAVSGGKHGIFGVNNGSGALSINANNVTGTNSDGINAENNGTNLAITSTGTVLGGKNGIYSINNGSGALTINANNVTGTGYNVGARSGYFGIFARNYGTDLSVTSTGAVEGRGWGIYADNKGSGALSLNVVDVTGLKGDGVSAKNTGTDLSITSTGTVIGTNNGIQARNFGPGAINITANNVTGTNRDGIYALNNNGGADLSITTIGTVLGGNRGIYARQNGSGALNVNANNVTGTSNDGIYAYIVNSGSDLSITTTGAVVGGKNGIRAFSNYSTGAWTINTVDVTGTGRDGISARNAPYGTDLSITSTGTVLGQKTGINAQHYGTGALTINANNVSGTDEFGIYGFNNSGTDLSITATGDVLGGSNGVRARNYGSGALTINANNVTGTNAEGIYAFNNNSGTDISITSTGNVVGNTRGILAFNNGSGAITVTANNVTSANSYGIQAQNGHEKRFSGTSISVTSTGAVSGSIGIFSSNYGSGALAINANDVTGTGGDGINAGNINGTGSLTIVANNVSGTRNAISATNGNSGADLSVATTGTVEGGDHGINASNRGSGALTINTVDVTGTSLYGITAGNSGTDLSITSTGTVSGGRRGINASNGGSGNLTINVNDVTGTGEYAFGIDARNNGTDLSITSTGLISSASHAIRAYNRGSGALTINANNVTGTSGDGILATNRGTSLSVTTTGTITAGGYAGIYARNYGSGALTITAGNVNGTNNAIIAKSSTGGATINVGGNVNGENRGISLRTRGDNVINIIAGSSVMGDNFSIDTAGVSADEDEDAIPTETNDTVNNDGTILGDITTGSGVDTVNNSGTITGDADLGDGGNFFTNLLGGIFGGNLTTGSGNDTVANAGGMVGNVDMGDGANNFSNTGGFQGSLSAGAGDDIATNSGVFDGDVDFGAGINRFTNLAGGVFAPGSTINLGAGGNMVNAGNLLPGGNGVIQTTTITGNFIQSATGTIGLDIDDQAKARTDMLLVSGRADLAGKIVPNIINLSDDPSEFTIIVANGGATDSGLAVNDIEVVDTVGFDFEIVFEGNDVILTSNIPNTISELIKESTAGLSGSAIEDADSLARVLDAGSSESPALQELVTALRALPDTGSVASAIERLTPKSQARAATSAVTGVANAGNAMLSCQIREGDQRYTREGQCYWAKVTVRHLDRDATKDHSGVEENGVEVMGGLQWALWDELRMGLALGYGDINSDSNSQTQKLGDTEGQRFTAGLVLKDQWGPVNAYLNLVGSYGSYDLMRIAGLGFGDATAEQDITSFMTRLRLSYLMEGNGLYMRPMVDLNATYVDLDGYRERGAGAANLTVAGVDEWFLSVTPTVELGGEFRTADDMVVRPYLRGGVTFIDKDSMGVDVNFASAPAGVQPFTVNSQLEDMYGVVEAGLHILTPQGLNLKLSYDGRFSDDSQEHAGTLKIGKNF